MLIYLMKYEAFCLCVAVDDDFIMLLWFDVKKYIYRSEKYNIVDHNVDILVGVNELVLVYNSAPVLTL